MIANSRPITHQIKTVGQLTFELLIFNPDFSLRLLPVLPLQGILTRFQTIMHSKLIADAIKTRLCDWPDIKNDGTSARFCN